MLYMYHMARNIEKNLSEEEKETIKAKANERIIFDDKSNCYTLTVTDYIEELFGKGIIKEARIILDTQRDITKRNFVEEYAYIIYLCSNFNIKYKCKSFEDEDTYIEITFINDKKIGFWASKSKVVMEESKYK